MPATCLPLPLHCSNLGSFSASSPAFQNYLRTQAGNTTTINIILSTVDYLLRLQESIGDFYWHYSDQDTIDYSGRDNFLRAFKVTKQVIRTLTEYIQVRPRLMPHPLLPSNLARCCRSQTVATTELVLYANFDLGVQPDPLCQWLSCIICSISDIP